MKYGKIKDIDCIKSALSESASGIAGLWMRKAGVYLSKGTWQPCCYTIGRINELGCGSTNYVIGIVKCCDGSYVLEWDAETAIDDKGELINDKIKRGVIKIMAAYEACVAAKARHKSSYEDQESERQNQILENKQKENQHRAHHERQTH